MNAFSGCVPAGFGPGCGRGAGALGCGHDGSRPARPGPRPRRRSARRRGPPSAWPPPGSGPQQPTSSPPSRSGAVAPRWSAGQGPSATSGRVVIPTVGSPSTAPRCSARPARRGWSRPVALTTSTSGAIGRARTACSSSGPSRRASRAGKYGPPAGGGGRSRPRRRTQRRCGASSLDPFEADEADPDPSQGPRWLPAFRSDLREGLLQLDELVRGGRPSRHGR
jgi:hypothetical protein